MKLMRLKVICTVFVLFSSQLAWCSDEDEMPDIGNMYSDPWADYAAASDSMDQFEPDFSPRVSAVGEDLNASGARSFYGDFGEEPQAKAARISCTADQAVLENLFSTQRVEPAATPAEASGVGTAN